MFIAAMTPFFEGHCKNFSLHKWNTEVQRISSISTSSSSSKWNNFLHHYRGNGRFQSRWICLVEGYNEIEKNSLIMFRSQKIAGLFVLKWVLKTSPVDQFVCNPGETIKTSNSAPYSRIVCYGYILYNQLGICAGILSILHMVFRFLYRISRHTCGFIISIFLTVAIVVTITVLFATHARVDFLTYWLLSATLEICVFTVGLRVILRCFTNRWTLTNCRLYFCFTILQ